MAKGDVLGHIDCPSCGLEKGMRITEDKNGAPFGYCEGDCDQQMRIGGSAARVNKFFARYPHIRRPGTVTDTAPAAPPPEVKKTVPETEKPPAKTAPAPQHWTEILGVKA